MPPTRSRVALALTLVLAVYNSSSGIPYVCAADTPVSFMKPVRSYQARVESAAPVWDAQRKVFVSGFGDESRTFHERYENTLDSVTTASVEGALMYLQRDCIDVGSDPIALAQCKRKNDAKVITFLEVTIVQPFHALSYYQTNRYIYPEFCPFVTMQNGQCVAPEEDVFADMLTTTGMPTTTITSTSTTSSTTASASFMVHPPDCQLYHGLYPNQSTWNIGPCVGAHAYPTDMVAPYPDTIWFSYPGSCVMKTWVQGKSSECRDKYRGGLCSFGTEPDGVTCTFKYKILGYLNIDELVGITASTTGSTGAADDVAVGDTGAVSRGNTTHRLANATATAPTTAKTYNSYKDFCEAKGVELHSFDASTTLGLFNVTTIPFWRNPSSRKANVERTKQMIERYNANVATATDGRMQPLPTNLSALTESNPPCHKNAKICYDARFGCKRHSYAQVCTVCREQGVNCVTKVPSIPFPSLATPPVKNLSVKSLSASSSSSSSSNSAAAVRCAGRHHMDVATTVLAAMLLAALGG